MMKPLYEELGGTYTLGDDGMLYPDLAIDDNKITFIIVWHLLLLNLNVSAHSSASAGANRGVWSTHDFRFEVSLPVP